MEEYDIGYPHSNSKRYVRKVSIQNKMKAFELGEEYYDGARENGYGGYNYDGRWGKIMPSIIDRYGLTNESAVLDIGAKKGFFMHDLKETLPGIKVKGIESSQYPIDHAMESVKKDILLGEYDLDLPYEDNEFDFVMAFAAIYMFNLRGVMKSLREMQRVGKGRSYVTVGAYRNKEERELFCDMWTLLGTTVLHVDEWKEVFQETGYTGDYYFTTASSLNLVKA